nr:hypothetical protein [Borreliella burgdorferi]
MKKNIYILNIFLYIPLFYSCFLTPPKSSKINKIKNPGFDFKKIEKENITKYNKDTIKESNKNICLSLEEPEPNKIKEGEVFEPLAFGYVPLKEVDSLALCNVQLDLDSAYNDFF